jgi:hypothetical protein
VQEILIDRDQLVVEDLVQMLDNFFIALHSGSCFACARLMQLLCELLNTMSNTAEARLNAITQPQNNPINQRVTC